MKKKKRRVGEGVVALAVCVAILLLAWGVAMAVVMAFASAWVRDPMPEVTSVQRQIAVEALEKMRLE